MLEPRLTVIGLYRPRRVLGVIPPQPTQDPMPGTTLVRDHSVLVPFEPLSDSWIWLEH